MDINKLALELQQNQSVRQKIYAQYMNNQDDFFFQNFHGILEEKVLFEYLQHAQKHKKLMKLLPAILCFSTQTTLSARVIRKIQRLPISARRNCVFSLAHCELSVFQACVLFSIVQEMELFCFILDDMLRKEIYSLADVQLLVGFAKGINKLVIQDVLAQIEKEQIPLKAKEKVQWLRVKVGIEKEKSSY